MLGIYCKNHHKPHNLRPPPVLSAWHFPSDLDPCCWSYHIISYHISYITFDISYIYIICHKTDIIYHIYIYVSYNIYILYMMFTLLLVVVVVVVHNHIISYFQNNSMKLLPLRPRTPRWSSSAWRTSWSSRRTRSCSTTPRRFGRKRVCSKVFTWKRGEHMVK
jgi:hypothetical protein